MIESKQSKKQSATESMVPLRNFVVLSLAYCMLTFTDGALRTVILLHATTLGFSPLEIARHVHAL